MNRLYNWIIWHIQIQYISITLCIYLCYISSANAPNMPQSCSTVMLTHWGRVTHICVGKLTIIGWDNGLSPGQRQAIIWTNAGILSIGPLGTNFNEILIGIQTFSFKKMHFKMSSAKWRPFCLSLNELSDFCLGYIFKHNTLDTFSNKHTSDNPYHPR